MSEPDQVNIGIVGAAGRGAAFARALRANGGRVQAVCDIREDRLEECRQELGAEEAYADYERMLAESDLEAVVVGTPMPLHVPQSVAALQRGLHVLCEVPAGVSVEECKKLVLACRESDAVYMMAENYVYTRTNALIRELARQGLFGDTFYAEGEYLHELKELNERTPWRRKWQTGIDGITYPTHSLGPLLQWMEDRVVRVCCAGAGRHYEDPRGQHYHEESPVMLGRTARGGLVKVRVDMVSDRPHAMHNYQLQGTDGVFESGRGGPGDRDKIWLRELGEPIEWHDLGESCAGGGPLEEYLPEDWRNPPEGALRAGHGGGDFFVVRDFLRAVRGQTPCPIGVHEAMDMTLPGLISQKSVARGGSWLAVPDSREWFPKRGYAQLHMVWPESRLDHVPKPELESGYELRCFRQQDTGQYCELMAKAGFEGWDEDRVREQRRRVLPNGLFVVEHSPTRRLVATALAEHHPTDRHPEGGELGWVAGDPAHSGRGLGMAVCAAVLDRFVRAGYRRIYLQTDDWRLAAVKTYLKLGFEPLLYREDMEKRWRALYEKLGWPWKR